MGRDTGVGCGGIGGTGGVFALGVTGVGAGVGVEVVKAACDWERGVCTSLRAKTAAMPIDIKKSRNRSKYGEFFRVRLIPLL
jgi:hypothetical protein